ncbi:DoxX family protein [Pararhizobium haloflavum]|uniref:DoxX family protein n=1 Tax=Pararhizobium haloflavum TaxID=2037914 RepID=UPI000C197765|nr:DoxX family protein [Pararhizobium haloflavum]
MTQLIPTASDWGSRIRMLSSRGRGVAQSVPSSLLSLAARLVIASVFWASGRTKIDGLTIKPQTYFLFEHEYALPLIDPRLAAVMATVAEHFFPILLVIGLATRLSAFALLLMTLIIQVFVYPEAWQIHGLWAVCLLLLIKHGPGRFSIDHGLSRRGTV